jgi:spermidine/putrescine transport system ATP-binding protein
VSPGSQLELTVRPEKIDLTTERPPGEGCALRGTVTEVVYLGTSTNFSVSTTAGADVVVFQQNSHGRPTCRPGDSVWLSWSPQHSYPDRLADGQRRENEGEDEPRPERQGNPSATRPYGGA